MSYEDDVHPYTDLVLGRLDAVLLDNVLAERRQRTMTTGSQRSRPEAWRSSHYVGVLAPANAALRDRSNEILRRAMRDGTLERIFRKWEVWNDDQPRLFAQGPRRRSDSARRRRGSVAALRCRRSRWDATLRYLPSLLRASVVTILFSCLSMVLAVVLGVLIASGRVYGNRSLRTL